MKALNLNSAKTGMSVIFNGRAYESQKGIWGVISRIGVYGLIEVTTENGTTHRGYSYSLFAMPTLLIL